MERINSILVGAPRQGKTFWGEKTLIEYAKNGGCSVVYNVGRITDFSKFIPVEIMTVGEYKNLWEKWNRKQMAQFDVPKEVIFFKAGGKLYHLKDFSRFFSGKCVKIERVLNVGNQRNEDYFLAAIYKYFYNTCLMFDDCRTIFRKGLSSEMIGLLSRINHAGKHNCKDPKMVGIDTILTYHGFDTVNNETYQYINKVIQFRTSSMPFLKIDNTELESIIEQNYHSLKNSEKYSHFEYDIFTESNHFFKP